MLAKGNLLSSVRERGFDRSYYLDVEGKYVEVRCSQCEALVVNGVPTHERGCPHEGGIEDAEEI